MGVRKYNRVTEEEAMKVGRKMRDGGEVEPIDRVIEAFATWHGDAVDEISMLYWEPDDVSKGLTGGLHTSDRIKPRPRTHRGTHESVIGDSRVIAVFYNGLGWVDIGYKLYKAICKKFDMKPGKPRRNCIKLLK